MGKKRSSKRQQTAFKKPSLKTIIVSFVVLLVATVAVVASDQQAKVEHDLSVIGNGKATVVQIHDPQCQLCQRLKRTVGHVKDDFADQVQFRTANIKTDKGREFAASHNVPHVTLVLFDKYGKRVNILRGVNDRQTITNALQRLVQ